MFQYRQVLVRLRHGDTDREIARSRLMGRPKAAYFRGLAGPDGVARAASFAAERRRDRRGAASRQHPLQYAGRFRSCRSLSTHQLPSPRRSWHHPHSPYPSHPPRAEMHSSGATVALLPS